MRLTHWPDTARSPEAGVRDPLLIITVRVPQPRTVMDRWMFGLYGPLPPVERRMFGDPALNEHIDRVMASLPADKRGAKINVGFDEGGVQGVLVVRLNKDWTIKGGVMREKGGRWSGEVGAEWSF